MLSWILEKDVGTGFFLLPTNIEQLDVNNKYMEPILGCGGYMKLDIVGVSDSNLGKDHGPIIWFYILEMVDVVSFKKNNCWAFYEQIENPKEIDNLS